MVLLARNGAKLLSSDKVWTRFCLQFSKLFIALFFETLHCFEAGGEEAMAVVVYWVYERIEHERRKMFDVSTYLR